MDKWYEGVVHLVRRDNVGLRFAPSFPFSPTTTYSVRFTFNRYPLRRQHQAIHRPFMEDRVFFLVETHIKLANSAHTLRLHNAHIASNPEQLLAVKTIVNLPPGAHPFIVYGPYVLSHKYVLRGLTSCDHSGLALARLVDRSFLRMQHVTNSMK
jgi:helicase MOV-10